MRKPGNAPGTERDELTALRARVAELELQLAASDVQYQDLIADPQKEVRRVYDFIGLQLSAETEATMQRWMRENVQSKHGVHDYKLEDFGLDRKSLDPHFEPYRARYGVATES